MRALILSLFILLTSCATTNYYNHTITSWQGSASSALIASWGQPNQVIKLADGTQSWAYIRPASGIGYNKYQDTIYAANRKGKAFAVQTPSSTPPVNLVGCTTFFIVNKQGIITKAHFHGGDCVGKPRP